MGVRTIPAAAWRGGGDQRVDGRRLGEIRRERLRLPTGAPDPIDHRARVGRRGVMVHGDGPSVGREVEGDRTPHPAAGPRHQRDARADPVAHAAARRAASRASCRSSQAIGTCMAPSVRG
ncbi:MAG: hypothetical protein RI891_905, partial [Gemmatimonadota bacterium]